MSEKTFILKNNKNIIQEVADFISKNRKSFVLPFDKQKLNFTFKENKESQSLVKMTLNCFIEKKAIRSLAIEIIASAIYKFKPTDNKFLEKEASYFQNTETKKSDCINAPQTLYDIQKIETFI
jgi:hypothetical protein